MSGGGVARICENLQQVIRAALNKSLAGRGFSGHVTGLTIAHEVKTELLDSGHRGHGLEARITGDWFVAVLIGVITFVVFGAVLSHSFLDAWDDNVAITENPDFNPATFGKLVHYWVPPPRDEFFVPVMYSLWGVVAMAARGANGEMHPAAFHALNLIGHSLAAVVAFLILRRLTGQRWAAVAGAVVFALHPIQTEAVAWASSAYTPISGVLGLLAVYLYMKSSDARDGARQGRGWWVYGLATFVFLVAMLTKPAAVSVPLIAVAVEAGVTRKPLKGMLFPLGAWVLISVPIVVATRHGTPGATVGRFELWQKLVVALDAVSFYLFKIVLPVRLSPDYGRSPNWVLSHPAVWVAGLVPIALAVSALLLRRRAAWLIGAAAVFLLGLLPTLGFAPFNFQTFSTVADRYAYLSMFGVAVAVTMVLAPVRKAWLVRGIIWFLALSLSVLSVRQIRHWRDNWTLFAYTLRTNAQSRIVSAQLRFLLNPVSEARCTLSAPELVAMGDLLMGQKRSNLAAPVYGMAIDHGATDPATRNALARAQIQSEQLPRASATLKETIRLNPTNAEAHALLGDVLSRSGADAAAEEYRTALSLDPHNADARRGLSLLTPATQPAR